MQYFQKADVIKTLRFDSHHVEGFLFFTCTCYLVTQDGKRFQNIFHESTVQLKLIGSEKSLTISISS